MKRNEFVQVKKSDLMDIYMSMMFLQQRLELLKKDLIDMSKKLNEENEAFDKRFVNG